MVTAVQFCKTVTQAATDAAAKIREHKLRAFEERGLGSHLLGKLFDSNNPFDYDKRMIWEVYQPDLVIERWMKETWATEICSAVVSNLEKPSEGINQLKKHKQPDQNMKIRQKTRAWYLLEGDRRGHESLKVALKKVCHDECADLVKKLTNETITWLLPFDKHSTLEERCANLVVREVESETLGCCARSCGWNGAACGLWDFMNDEDKRDWKLECCAEGAILKGSFASQPGVLRSRRFPSVCVISGPMSL